MMKLNKLIKILKTDDGILNLNDVTKHLEDYQNLKQVVKDTSQETKILDNACEHWKDSYDDLNDKYHKLANRDVALVKENEKLRDCNDRYRTDLAKVSDKYNEGLGQINKWQTTIEASVQQIEKWEGQAYQAPDKENEYQGDDVYQAVRDLKLLVGNVLTYSYTVEFSPIVHPCLNGEVQAVDKDEAFLLAKGKIEKMIDDFNSNLIRNCGMGEHWKLESGITEDNLVVWEKS